MKNVHFTNLKCSLIRTTPRKRLFGYGSTIFFVHVVETSSMEQYGVALGYTAHLVSLLGQVLQVPLQYPIKPCGSKSTISDHISEEVVIDTIKE